MKRIENSIRSEKFGDGICYIYKVDDNDEIIEESGLRLNFGERNLTYKRILEAAQIQCSYTKVIGVPLIRPECYGGYRCIGIEGTKYRIETVQEIMTASPPTAVIGLSRWGIETRI